MVLGLSWDGGRPRVVAVLAALATLLVLFAPIPAAAASPLGGDDVAVVVREVAPSTDTAEYAVESLGGTVGEELAIIGGFTANIPPANLGQLQQHPAIVSVTLDADLAPTTAGWQDATNLGDYVPNEWKGSMLHTGYAIGVDEYWRAGYTGTGVGIALIDTGVVPVDGLTLEGKIVNGPDLSFESQSDALRYMDTYGHGTHLAGIMAGRDPAAPQQLRVDDGESYFLGIAPDAHIVNVKVADRSGAVDVSQVIAAIDWVVAHKDDPGLNIRVINLSYGTDSVQDPSLDPLSFAVEQAWHNGIAVVVAAGNDGNDARLRNPATNPYVIAVGAADHGREKGKGAKPLPEWSSCGDDRNPDFIAPGASIVSLRDPGSVADIEHPEARVAERFFLGSGTSQAAAVVSGAIALVLDRNPEYGPDDVKRVLADGAKPYRKVSSRCQGEGIINLHNTWWETPVGPQLHGLSTGLGTLEGSRGTFHLEADGVVLEGEIDIMGSAWDPVTWTTLSASGSSWSGGTWNGSSWSGSSWSGSSWSGSSWSGSSWSGSSWSGSSWSGSSWSGSSWSGSSWSGSSWSGSSWSGSSWSGSSWSGVAWN